MHTLTSLPVELLYEIQLFATSHTLPQTCKVLRGVFASSPPSYRAQYLVACTGSSRLPKDVVLTKMLRYPICTKDVLEAYFRTRSPSGEETRRLGLAPELPRRLFRALALRVARGGNGGRSTAEWTERDPPLPFLRFLYACPHLHPPNVNSHDGYALAKAVQAGSVPLVRFLLDRGASPARKSNLPVMIAIHRKDLSLVRMLVERADMEKPLSDVKPGGKRRKLEDRVEVTQEMLKAAVKCRAQDIVEYLTREKGCIPDMQTLLLMR